MKMIPIILAAIGSACIGFQFGIAIGIGCYFLAVSIIAAIGIATEKKPI